MWTWPTLELTDYEKKFVRVYKDGNYPGVLRRTYEVFFNTVADPLTPGLETVKLRGQVQIARRARVFALGFAGRLGSFRLKIETGSGEQLTPRLDQSDGDPVVSSMLSGGMWNALSALGDQPFVFGLQTPGANPIASFFGNETTGPLLIDPNWELSPNEMLIFNATPIENQTTLEFQLTPPAQKVMAIAVHVWEFPNMMGRSARQGGGPQVKEDC